MDPWIRNQDQQQSSSKNKENEEENFERNYEINCLIFYKYWKIFVHFFALSIHITFRFSNKDCFSLFFFKLLLSAKQIYNNLEGGLFGRTSKVALVSLLVR